MKKLCYILLLAAVVLSSCKKEDRTYAEQLQEEKKRVEAFMKTGIPVFDEQGNVERRIPVSVSKDLKSLVNNPGMAENQFVYLEDEEVYINIVHNDTSAANKKYFLNEGQTHRYWIRFVEYDIYGDSISLENRWAPALAQRPEDMSATRASALISGTFIDGVMGDLYGSTAPQGWLLPLQYVTPGRQGAVNGKAKVRLIVKSASGHGFSNQYVRPYYYELTYFVADR